MSWQPWRAAFLHLRIPFSLLLLPPFVMALVGLEHLRLQTLLGMFFILHFLTYAASNGYNSYFDQDQGSIGGLKHPPPVGLEVLLLALVFDLTGLVLATQISWLFVASVALYSLVSLAYSHPRIRLKKYPWIGFFVVVFFQGCFVVVMVRSEFQGMLNTWRLQDWSLAFLSTLGLFGAYPLSQIYQHQEDEARGDLTLSRLLGVEQTWNWARAWMAASVIGNLIWVLSSRNAALVVWFLIVFGFLGAVVFRRFGRSHRNQWNYENVMFLNSIGSVAMTLFWGGICLIHQTQLNIHFQLAPGAMLIL